MKVIVKNVDLARELGLLEKIVGKKPTIPVLSNVLIQANAGGLLLSATDLEIGLIGACTAEVEEPGAVTLPARKLMELVRAQSDTQIRLFTEKTAVKFTSGGFNSRLQSLPASDFPKLPPMDGHPTLVLPRAVIKEAIAQVRFSISDTDQRYFLKGALLTLSENMLVMASTDQSRLSLTRFSRIGDADEPVLIPSKALDELSALLMESGTDDITFARSERHLFFDLDGRLLISRQVEGKFPAYERFIPKGNKYQAQINRIEFATVLKRLVLIASTVLLTVSEEGLDVSSTSAEVGEGVERLRITYEGPKIDIRFNGQYVLDFLNAASGDSVGLALLDGTSPALFSDGAYINVIMGMRI